jgi:hypothetical protein
MDAIEVAAHVGTHMYAVRIDGDSVEMRVDGAFVGYGVWRGGRIVDIDFGAVVRGYPWVRVRCHRVRRGPRVPLGVVIINATIGSPSSFFLEAVSFWTFMR